MGYYPVFLKSESLKVFLAGAGEVGRRKASSLLQSGLGDLLWVDPQVSREALAAMPGYCGGPDFSVLLESPGLRYEQRAACEQDLEGRSLAFAATGCRKTNAMLAEACRARGILCNVIDAPDEGDFIAPAHFRQGDILVAFATGGHSPALARRLREDLQGWLGGRYGPLLDLLARLRPLLLELGAPSAENREVFRALVNSELAGALARGDQEAARAILAGCLPEELRSRIGEILS